jgi:hypothetical protein
MRSLTTEAMYQCFPGHVAIQDETDSLRMGRVFWLG